MTIHADRGANFTCVQHWSKSDQGWKCYEPYDGPKDSVCVANLVERPDEVNISQVYVTSDGRVAVITYKPHSGTIQVFCIPNSNSNIPI